MLKSLKVLQCTAAHVQNNTWQRAIIFIRAWGYSIFMIQVSFKLHSKHKPALIIVIIIINYHPLEDVPRYRDPQDQVVGNHSYFFVLI